MKETAKYQRALQAIVAVFADRSVPVEQTAELLENLRDEADIYATTCREN